MAKGWHGESKRHSEAARGRGTGTRRKRFESQTGKRTQEIKVSKKYTVYVDDFTMLGDFIKTEREWLSVLKEVVSRQYDNLSRKLKIKVHEVYYDLDEGRPVNNVEITVSGSTADLEKFEDSIRGAFGLDSGW